MSRKNLSPGKKIPWDMYLNTCIHPTPMTRILHKQDQPVQLPPIRLLSQLLQVAVGSHAFGLLLARGHSVLVTARLPERERIGWWIKNAYPNLSRGELDFAIVDDMEGPYGTCETSRGRSLS